MKYKLYLDSCIWLNLFKQEIGNNFNKPFYRYCYNILINQDFIIFYSRIIIKEIKYVLRNNLLFKRKKEFIVFYHTYINLYKRDYELAREFEELDRANLSFYDYLHISICKNNKFILITRDNDMIEFAKKHIIVYKPEEILELVG